VEEESLHGTYEEGVEGPGEVLFVTDLEAEAQAARAAGMQTRISLRPGNAPLEQTAGPEAFACISSLWELPGLEL
jgi:FMN phosphatase YigB (HAD superfamily)